MDIQAWLENTADNSVPVEDDRPAVPDFLRSPHRKERPKPTHRRAKAFVISDSSIVEPGPRLHHHHARTAEVNHGLDSDPIDISEANSSDAGSGQSRSSFSHHTSHENPPNKSYERRARHKTRPDRYEHKPKKRKSKDDATDHRKARPKRHKAHRQKDGGRTEGLVQSFQLKNGPRANRLTLKPQAAVGIFSHGRASMQMPGRGHGLPDLVFNEMRFLQKPKEHQDEVRAAKPAEKSSRKDRNQQREEEISAYFATRRPDSPKQIENGRMIGSEQNAKHQLSRQKGLDQINDQQINQGLVVERDRAVLGSGRKATGSDRHARVEDSCFTWSASLPCRPEGATASLESEPPIVNLGRLQKHENQRKRLSGDSVDNLLTVENDSRTNKKVTDSRLRTKSVSKLPGPATPCPPSDPKDPVPQNARAATKASSLPLPTATPFQRNARIYSYEGGEWLRQEYHTSDILNVPQDNEFAHEARNDLTHRGNKENLDPYEFKSSTPASTYLRHALDNVSHPHQTRKGDEPEERPMPEDFVDFANLELSRMLDAHRQASLKWTQINETRHLNKQTNRKSNALPERGTGNTAKRAAPLHEPLARNHVPLWQNLGPTNEHDLQYNDEESLGSRNRHSRLYTSEIGLDHTEYSNLFDGPNYAGHPYDVMSFPRDEARYLEESLPEPLSANGGRVLENNYHQDTNFRGENDAQSADNEFAGFWRPHRLY